ncbi:MAG: hypothetical protein RLZZ630_1165 [Bacteroidota bacterium]
MQQQILANIDHPEQLERLYRENRTAFTASFNVVFPQINTHPLALAWHARLNYKEDGLSWGSIRERWIVAILCLLAGALAKLPQFTGISEEFFYPRNITFVLFPFLVGYFLFKRGAVFNDAIKAGLVILVSSVYINLLPGDEKHDTFILACVHLPFVLWSVTAFAFSIPDWKDHRVRLDFLRFNGDLVVMTALILLAGGILTAITLGLFSLIGLNIEEFYFKYIVVWGLASAPIVATHLVQVMPQLVERVSPVIARVFTPLVVVMLSIYLIAVLTTGKDPYNDREFLLMFNGLLIGVMAIILFSVAGTANSNLSRIGYAMLLVLSLLTLTVNGIALSAILFRISEWGITPNRMAVLGGNVVIMGNLMMVAWRLVAVMKRNRDPEDVGRCIASYIPIYAAWAAIVAFLFPVLFGFC